MNLIEGLAILGGFVGLIGLWLRLRHVRLNDLGHLDERLTRIEKKLDEHLLWHIDHPNI